MIKNNEFAVHKLNDFGLSKMEENSYAFDYALTTIANICPDGREMSIVRTKMEEACFFAKKSLAKSLANELSNPTVEE